MRQIIIRYGLLGGLIVGGIMAISMLSNYHSMLLGYTSMILAFSLIYVAVKTIRDNVSGGVISFGKAFKSGLFITLITSSIYVLVWLVCYYFFMPDFMQKYSAEMMQQAKANGMSTAEQAKQAASMQEYAELYKNPLFVILLTYLEILPVGVLVSLIVALILKRKQGKELAIAS